MTETMNRRLRRQLVSGAGMLLPGAANALAARLIEDAGFPAVYVTGAGIANTYLGVPDMGLVSVTEVADHIRAIRDVVNVPLLVDGDTGFGNALNMGRTVRLFERAGANLIQIEDQVFPKRCGHFEGKSVVRLSEMVQKIKAAVDAREDSDFLIMARTDARAIEGFEASLERAQAFREAGADVLFVEAPRTVEELKAIPAKVPGIHVCNMVVGGKTPILPRDTLAEMGFAGIIYANAALQVSVKAMETMLGHLGRKGTISGAEQTLASFDERQKVVRYSVFTDLEKRYAED